MNLNKTIGYILLALGLVVIIGALFQSYNIFAGKALAPLVFITPSPQELSSGNSQNLQQQLQSQIDQAIQKQLNQILAPATITKILNLIAWTMLAIVLIFGGSVISGVGIKMIRI